MADKHCSEYNFCGKCGNPMVEYPFCKECGKQLLYPEIEYCEKCGTKRPPISVEARGI
jgi:predicted amidophosphoribosyltransferase